MLTVQSCQFDTVSFMRAVKKEDQIIGGKVKAINNLRSYWQLSHGTDDIIQRIKGVLEESERIKPSVTSM